MRILLTVALAGLLFTITGCAKSTTDAAAADEAPAAEEAAPAAEEVATTAEEAGDEHAHVDDAVCTCGKGKAGESVWCEGCGVGYVEGAKMACKGCYEAKVNNGPACEACAAKAAAQ